MATEALDGLLYDSMLIAAGGFGLCGIPELLIDALVESDVKVLTVASNKAGVDDFGPGKLLATRQIKKMISSYVSENAEFMRSAIATKIQATLEQFGHGYLPNNSPQQGAGTSSVDGIAYPRSCSSNRLCKSNAFLNVFFESI